MYKTVLQPDGKILVAGNFRVVDNRALGGIVRLKRDGTPDTTFTPPDLRDSLGGIILHNVYAIALQANGKILIGGSFVRADGLVRLGAARLNTDGTLDTSFDQTSSGNAATLSGTVYDIKIQNDGKVILAGVFTHSSTRHNLVRLGSNGEVDGSFFAGNVGDINDVFVQADGKIVYVGGRTSPIMPTFNRLNADGTDDPTFTTNTFGGAGIHRIVRQADGKFLIAGEFVGVNGFSQIKYLARFGSNGAFDAAFNTNNDGASSDVFGLGVLSNGKIAITGAFSDYNGVSRTRIALLNSDGTLDKSFNYSEQAESGHDITIMPSDNLLVGSSAVDRFGISRNRALIKLDALGLADPNFSPAFGVNGNVYRIKVQNDGKILALGGFYQANGEPRVNLARFNPDGSLDTAFDPMIFTSVLPGDFGPLDVQGDGKILVSTFRLNPDGSLDSAFTGSPARDIKVQSDGKILYAGTTMVRKNSDGTTDTGFAVTYNNFVYKALTQSDGKILIAGRFTEVNGVNRGSIARLKREWFTRHKF